jgi:hypothetical protein
MYPEAVNELREIVRDFRSFGDAYLLLYEIYSRTGKISKADQLARDAIDNQDLHESYRIRFKQLLSENM